MSYSNIAWNSKFGIVLGWSGNSGVDDNNIYGNTIVDCETTFYLANDASGKHTIKNNISYNPTLWHVVFDEDYFTNTLVLKSNHYWPNEEKFCIVANISGSYPDSAGKCDSETGSDNTDKWFSGWASYIGNEQYSATGNGAFPDFDDYANGDFHIGALSDAIDAAGNLGSPYNLDFDYHTRPASGLWDVGAYQY